MSRSDLIFEREDSSAKGALPGLEPESPKARHSNKRLGFTTLPLERPDYTYPDSSFVSQLFTNFPEKIAPSKTSLLNLA
ncbi:hypothetical protein PROFUN_11391 [Planoprotostelium fungivorum]|uniref:Uncharacterized protein n=1 Tax=Planoprotostelium fungivorum TaxID=1890364 RepID=A0A2P6N327_9EUKA|nr:hypothetical protein PROFUN_11391 [Planoprotostelium fungivorum]